MFKISIVIVALAVSASLAASVPRQQQQQQVQKELREPMAAATVMSHQQKQKNVYVTEVKEQPTAGHGLGGHLLKVVQAPKKLIGAVAGLIVGKLRSLSAKGLLKIALLSGLVAVVGAVAAVVAVSVAGLVALITGFCATAMHFLGGGGGGGGEGRADDGKWAESNMDEVSEFVLNAFDKYGEMQ